MPSSDGNNSINITGMDNNGVDVESLDVVLDVEKSVGERLGFHERYENQLSITSSRSQDRSGNSSAIGPLICCILLFAMVWYRRRRQDNLTLPLKLTRSDNTKNLIGASSKEHNMWMWVILVFRIHLLRIWMTLRSRKTWQSLEVPMDLSDSMEASEPFKILLEPDWLAAQSYLATEQDASTILGIGWHVGDVAVNR